jgi:hypothetical protein
VTHMVRNGSLKGSNIRSPLRHGSQQSVVLDTLTSAVAATRAPELSETGLATQRNLARTKRFIVVGGASAFAGITGTISCSSIPHRLQKMRLLESAFRTGTCPPLRKQIRCFTPVPYPSD